MSPPNDISATNLRSTTDARSLKVKSLDLLKSNPRLKYLIPDLPPPPPSTARSSELQFHHDGRGLFAAKTVANLADDLDTSGLRKLLERDTRRYQSSYELRQNYYRRQMPGEIPQSRGNATISTEGYERSFRGERPYNPFMDPGPSTTIRPILRSDRSESMDSQRFESAQSYRLYEDADPHSIGPFDVSSGKHNLLQFCYSEKSEK